MVDPTGPVSNFNLHLLACRHACTSLLISTGDSISTTMVNAYDEIETSHGVANWVWLYTRKRRYNSALKLQSLTPRGWKSTPMQRSSNSKFCLWTPLLAHVTCCGDGAGRSPRRPDRSSWQCITANRDSNTSPLELGLIFPCAKHFLVKKQVISRLRKRPHTKHSVCIPYQQALNVNVRNYNHGCKCWCLIQPTLHNFFTLAQSMRNDTSGSWKA